MQAIWVSILNNAPPQPAAGPLAGASPAAAPKGAPRAGDWWGATLPVAASSRAAEGASPYALQLK